MTSIPTNYSYNYANDRVKFKYLEKMDVSPEFPNKRVQLNVKKFMLRRNRLSRETKTADKIQAAVGATVGTIVPGLRIGGGFGERLLGFPSSYKSGANEAGRTLRDIEKEGE